MSATHNEWPRVPILPDPEEDIRILGVPIGRLPWLGPLLVVPLILIVAGVSLGTLAVLPFALVVLIAIYALFGLDLWRPLVWKALRLSRPRQHVAAVSVARGNSSTAEDPELPPWFVRVDTLIRRITGRTDTAAEEPPEAVLADPPAVAHGDPEGQWRRWTAALRRALSRGATVQVAVWIGADWDPELWDAEQRELNRLEDGNLKDIAMARWNLHRAMALSVGRRTPHLVRVIPGPGTPPGMAAELARHFGQALAGSGTWRPARGTGLEDALRQWADWPGWFLAAGGGAPDMLSLWSGRPEGTAEPLQADSFGSAAEEPESQPGEELWEGPAAKEPGEDLDTLTDMPADAATALPPETPPAHAAPAVRTAAAALAARAASAAIGIVSTVRARTTRPPEPDPAPFSLPPGHGGVVVILGRAGVGKTTAAAGLAAALGRAGASVIAVDAARPQPRLGFLLGAWQTSGFREALRGAPLDWCISGTPAPGVDLIASGMASIGGEPPPDPSAVTALVRALAARHHWVIVDTPGGMQDPEAVGALAVASAAVWVVDGDPLDLAKVRDMWPKTPGGAVHCAVVLRADARVGADAETLSARLDLPVIGEIPERRGKEWAALARGAPSEDAEWDRAAAALAELVGAPLCQQSAAAV